MKTGVRILDRKKCTGLKVSFGPIILSEPDLRFCVFVEGQSKPFFDETGQQKKRTIQIEMEANREPEFSPPETWPVISALSKSIKSALVGNRTKH